MTFHTPAILLLFIFITLQSSGQTYSELSGSQIEARKLGSVATGDLNNDGYPDIVTTGLNPSSELATTIYRNNHDGTFTKVDVPGLTPTYNSRISLGDYNNDGYFDILLSGEGFDPLCVLWKNNGDLTFSPVDSGLEPLGGYNAELRDIDNDGDIDVLTSGMIRMPDGSYFSDVRIYKNAGNDRFQRQELAFTSYANVGTMGDYDNDGDLDLLTGGNWLEVYPNRGDGTFSSPKQLQIPLPIGQIKWFDQNNDGHLDFVVSGRGSGADEYYTDVYMNSGDPEVSFSKLSGTSFAGAMRQSIDTRDYNGDGKTDILFTATIDILTNDFLTTVYDNLGDSFAENANLTLPQLGGGDAVWFDLENDGDLDILMTGELVAGANVPKAIIMRNEDGTNAIAPNTLPSPPVEVGWSYNEEDQSVILSWGAGSDSETPISGLSYNVGIGSTTAGLDVLSPESNFETGARLINRTGNAGMSLQKPIRGLADGTYYFYVQTIDGALAGSAFTSPARFVVGVPEAPSEVAVHVSDTSDVLISWRDNSVNEFAFVVEARSHLETEFTPVGQVDADVTSFQLSDLANGTYTFRIKATNPNGTSANAETIVAVGIPEAPVALSVEVFVDEVRLAWADTPNEIAYVVERSLDGGSFDVRATLERDVTGFNDSPPSGLYQYRVKAINPSGESSYITTTPQTVVGIEFESLDPSVTFFPNPATNRLWIEGDAALLEHARFSLYNSRGQQISINATSSSLDLQGLGKGIYWLKARIGNETIVQKVIVE